MLFHGRAARPSAFASQQAAQQEQLFDPSVVSETSMRSDLAYLFSVTTIVTHGCDLAGSRRVRELD